MKIYLHGNNKDLNDFLARWNGFGLDFGAPGILDLDFGNLVQVVKLK
jgi:hypothetical protein